MIASARPTFTPRRRFRSFRRLGNTLLVATQLEPRRRVVMKSGDHVANELAVLRMLRGCAHIVQLVDVSDDGQTIVIPYACGGDLYRVLYGTGARRPVAEPIAQAWTAQLTRALIACHLRGIIHGDVKPENILFDSRSRVRLADFDHSIVRGGGGGVGRRSISDLGTIEFTSPEMMFVECVFESTDVWCLGLVVFEMLTGRSALEEARDACGPCSRASEGRRYARALRCTRCLSRTLRRSDERIQRILSKAKLSAHAAEFIRRACAHEHSHRPSAQELLSLPWLRAQILPVCNA